MGAKKIGNQTVKFGKSPSFISTSAIAGPKEGQGPLKLTFDMILEDEMWGESSWEKAESKIVKETYIRAVEKSKKSLSDIDYVIAGDLLNQCSAATFGLRMTNVPFFGVYGACSTMVESLSLGAMLIDGGFAQHVVCLTSSHFCSAEKQFRYPLELGNIKAPTSQWTVTGSGAVVLADSGFGPFVNYVTTGKIVDLGIKDANNMGAAMAPSAADTIIAHFRDTGLSFEDYDMVITGDLGKIGVQLCEEFLVNNGYETYGKLMDSGLMVFDLEEQNVYSGGSGCGCIAITLCGHIFREFCCGVLKNVLMVGTGALLSSTSVQQGESIPGIAHAVALGKMPLFA